MASQETKRSISGSVRVSGDVSIEVSAKEMLVREAAAEQQMAHQRKKWWLDVATFIVLTMYGLCTVGLVYESNQSLKAANAANNLTIETVRARMIFSSFNIAKPVTPGEKVEFDYAVKNIGKFTAFYGVNAHVFRWAKMPPGDIPLDIPSPSTPLEPELSPTPSGVIDPLLITSEFMNGVPTASEVMESSKNGRGGEVVNQDSPKPTLYFVGRLVYESIGPTQEVDFCFYLVQKDATTASLNLPASIAGDRRFLFLSCPRWNGNLKKPNP